MIMIIMLYIFSVWRSICWISKTQVSTKSDLWCMTDRFSLSGWITNDMMLSHLQLLSSGLQLSQREVSRWRQKYMLKPSLYLYLLQMCRVCWESSKCCFLQIVRVWQVVCLMLWPSKRARWCTCFSAWLEKTKMTQK